MSDEEGKGESLGALRALMSGITNCRLYPPEHPIASGAISALAQHLATILSREGEWRLAVVDHTLIAGGITIDEQADKIIPLIDNLIARGVDTIVFRRGVDPTELRRFVALLSVDLQRGTDAHLPEQLIAEGIHSIEVGRLVFEEHPEAIDTDAVLQEAGSEGKEVYDQAMEFIRETGRDVREGRKIRVWEAEAFVHSIIKQSQQDRSIFHILMSLKSHHAYTFTHIINVCILTLMQIEAQGGSPKMLREFGLASMLHDIGKCLVPQDILSKAGRLTQEEFALIQRHPQDGAQLLSQTPSIPDLTMIVAFEHHMRYNSVGYPRLKCPRSLHPCSLMTNIADTYDAMRSRRSYQAEQPPERVAALISQRAGTDFDPHLARAFLQIMGAYPPGTRVRLDNGDEALVVRVNQKDPFRPAVRLLKNNRGSSFRRAETVDLMQRETVGGRFKRSIVESISPSRREENTSIPGT